MKLVEVGTGSMPGRLGQPSQEPIPFNNDRRDVLAKMFEIGE